MNWTVNCQSTTVGACGAISNTGVYTAPLSPPPTGTVNVTATSQDNSVAASGAIVTLQLANGTLNGQYAFLFSGQSAGLSYLAAGSITFDGNGNVTGGTEDINSGGVSSAVTVTSGTYHVGTDGRTPVMLVTSAGTVNWQLAVVNHTHALVIRFDDGVPSASGALDLQNTLQFTSAAFNGSYAFNLSGAGSSGRPGSLAAAGALVSNGTGVISTGALDVNSAGTASTGLAVTGTYTAPSTSGRGTMVLSSSFGTQNFVYYIVDGTRLKVVETDATAQLAGDLLTQPAAPFSNTNLRSAYAFAFLGSSSHGPLGEAGIITLDGTGHVTGGTIDINDDGNAQGGLSVSGTYSVVDTATGRTTMTLSTGNSTYQYDLYPQLNGALCVVEIDSLNTIAGRALAQHATSFSSAALGAVYAINLSGADFTSNPGEEDLAGQMALSNFYIGGVIDISDNGVLARSQAFRGTYSLGTSGRASVTLTSSLPSFTAGNFYFYIADESDVLFLEVDGNRVLAGSMEKQY